MSSLARVGGQSSSVVLPFFLLCGRGVGVGMGVMARVVDVDETCRRSCRAVCDSTIAAHNDSHWHDQLKADFRSSSSRILPMGWSLRKLPGGSLLH